MKNWRQYPAGSPERTEALVIEALGTGVTGSQSIAFYAGITEDECCTILYKLHKAGLIRQKIRLRTTQGKRRVPRTIGGEP